MAATGRRRATRTAALVALAAVAVAVPAHAYPRPGRLELVSVSSAGVQANHRFGFSSDKPLLTPDGRYVVYYSYADNLVPGDTNEDSDVFVFDRHLRRVERASVTSDGQEAPNKAQNTSSFGYSVSADGRFVTFDTNGNFDPRDAGWRDAYVRDRASGATELLSVSTDGVIGDNDSYHPVVSGDGRVAVFDSIATNLVAGDTNGRSDVFLRDRAGGTTTRISVAPDGAQADGGSGYPYLTPDGRWALFTSGATNLVAGDVNRAIDTFVRDLVDGVTERVSLSSHGVAAAAGAQGVAITPDARFVLFLSEANNLVPEDSNGTYDVFVRDRATGRTERVNVSSDGAEANGYSVAGTISADGRYVAFYSDADNLVEGDTNGERDVFVRDRLAGTTERVSVGEDGAQGNGMSWAFPAVSDDGRFVAFMSEASNLVPHDANDAAGDIFVRDRGPSLGALEVSARRDGEGVEVAGAVTMSGGVVTSATDATGDAGALGGGAGDLTEAAVVYRPERGDLQVRLRVADLAPLRLPAACSNGVCTPTAAGRPGLAHGLRFTVLGVPWEVRALRLALTGNPAGTPRFELHRCDPTCAYAGALPGGYGRTDDEIQVSVPLSAFGLGGGEELRDLVAFSATREARGDVAEGIDEIALPAAAVPARRVSLGVAPEGTPADDVVYERDVALVDGTFAARVTPASLPPGPLQAWVRTCLGAACTASATPVR